MNAVAGKDGGAETKGSALGGQKGHRGVSRPHRPQGEEVHTFKRAHRCARCGRRTRIDRKPLVRDIVDVEITATETRHMIQTATCRCGAVCQAPSGLPVKGSYGSNMVGLVSALRASCVPFGSISGTVREITGIAVAKSTVINVTGRVCEAMRSGAGTVIGSVKRSKNAGIDETVVNLAGRQGYAWTIQSGNNISVIYSRSRSSLVMEYPHGQIPRDSDV